MIIDMICEFNATSFTGYQSEDVASKFSKFTDVKESSENNIDGLTNQLAGLNRVNKVLTLSKSTHLTLCLSRSQTHITNRQSNFYLCSLLIFKNSFNI